MSLADAHAFETGIVCVHDVDVKMVCKNLHQLKNHEGDGLTQQ